MKDKSRTIFAACVLISGLFVCSQNPSGPSALDTTVVGNWQGAIGAIPTFNFRGEKIFVNIARSDSSFVLVTRDTTRASTPVIKDTMLVLSGAWRLNSPKDSILLLCDSCRVVDTTLNVLSQRQVQGQVIPVGTPIDRQPDGLILWHVCLYDLSPLMPYIGLDLSGIPASQLQALLSGTIIDLEKMSQ